MNDRICELIEEAEELRESRDRFEALSKTIKDLIKDEFDTGEHEINDEFVVTKTEYTMTRYDIPDKIKVKFKKTVPATRLGWKRKKEDSDE